MEDLYNRKEGFTSKTPEMIKIQQGRSKEDIIPYRNIMKTPMPYQRMIKDDKFSEIKGDYNKNSMK